MSLFHEALSALVHRFGGAMDPLRLRITFPIGILPDGSLIDYEVQLSELHDFHTLTAIQSALLAAGCTAADEGGSGGTSGCACRVG